MAKFPFTFRGYVILQAADSMVSISTEIYSILDPPADSFVFDFYDCFGLHPESSQVLRLRTECVGCHSWASHFEMLAYAQTRGKRLSSTAPAHRMCQILVTIFICCYVLLFTILICCSLLLSVAIHRPYLLLFVAIHHPYLLIFVFMYFYSPSLFVAICCYVLLFTVLIYCYLVLFVAISK